MRGRRVWATRFGFYFAAIGSAFGLGSLWRFPYIVEENGGGAFVLLYLLLVSIVGIPLLISELILGKFSRKSIISAMKQIRAQGAVGQERLSKVLRYSPHIGWLIFFCCTLILAYYSVVSGWVLHFLIHFSSTPFVSDSETGILQAMDVLNSQGWLQILLTSTHFLIVVIIVAKGFEEGVERWVGIVMPLFVAILGYLLFHTLNLDHANEAIRFFLYPDFSQLKLSSLGYAVGHLCFTLSLGFATMVTFGSYLKDEVDVPAAGLRVATLDSFTAVIAGLIIFPLVMASPITAGGPELLFQTVPQFFTQIDKGFFLGFLFFLCLYFAALGASLSILETLVANLVDNMGWPRSKASWLAGGFCFLLSLVPALSSSVFSEVLINGRGLIEMIDLTLINWIVPLLALILSQIVCHRLSDHIKKQEFAVEGGHSQLYLYNQWVLMLKWVIPTIIISAFILQIINAF